MPDSLARNHVQLQREYDALLRRCEELQQQALEALQAREALAISEARLRQIIDLVPHFIFAKDSNGAFILANHAVANAYGTSVENLLSKTDADFAQSAEEVEAFRRDDLDVIRGGRPKVIPEEKITDSTGRVRLLHTTKIPFTFSGSSIPAVLGVAIDITEQKRAELERAELEKKILQAQKLESLGVLAGGVAHDFNNLLTCILGHADLVRELTPGPTPITESVDAIIHASRRAADLCRQLLAYAGKGHFHAVPLDVNALIRDVRRMLHVSIVPRASIQLELADTLSPVQADASQLQQVVLNLLVNAAESLPQSGGTVSINTCARFCDVAELGWLQPGCEEVKPGNYVVIEIRDDGCGMDAATRARMFEPFFTTKFTGRGLGLAAVLGIIQGHRGALDVRSKLGEGTRVRIYLPATDRLISPPAPESDEQWRGAGTVLVVDDEPDVRTACGGMLQQMGFEVVTVASGQEAIERLGEPPFPEFCCVILDLTMPRLDGGATLRQIRERGIRVPVLLSSGYSAEEAAAAFDRGEAAGFVPKPYMFADLQQALRRVLHR
ncbi:MAG: response regulator [Phycisphaerales bacterium]|nr:response regulator [Phycisphaerales bacterium]